MTSMEITAHLHLIGGAGTGMTWQLDKAKLVLGRHPDCDIAIENFDASRHHAQVLNLQNEFFLEDLHSTNGTFLNEQPVRRRQKINHGDRIRVSDVTFEFHQGGPLRTPLTSVPAKASVSVNDEAGDEKHVVLSQRGASYERINNRSWASLHAELKAMLRITQSLRRSLVLDEVLGPILDALFFIFAAADRGFIVLKNEDGSLVPRWSKFREGEVSENTRISRTLVNRVMESQQAVLSADITTDKRFEANESLDKTAHRSVMCAPLIDGEGRSFGACTWTGPIPTAPFAMTTWRSSSPSPFKPRSSSTTRGSTKGWLGSRTSSKNTILPTASSKESCPTTPPRCPGTVPISTSVRRPASAPISTITCSSRMAGSWSSWPTLPATG